MADEKDSVLHQYGQAIIVVLLTAAFAGIGAMLTRMDRIESRIMHRDALDARLQHLEFRIKTLEDDVDVK